MHYNSNIEIYNRGINSKGTKIHKERGHFNSFSVYTEYCKCLTGRGDDHWLIQKNWHPLVSQVFRVQCKCQKGHIRTSEASPDKEQWAWTMGLCLL